jgi:hypothetical protein
MNRRLTTEELAQANGALAAIRERLIELADNDPDLLFAYRRKIYKELMYDERDKPMVRRKLKDAKRQDQNGICPLCTRPLPEKYCVLDRLVAVQGYTAENTRLICQECDIQTQAGRGYA